MSLKQLLKKKDFLEEILFLKDQYNCSWLISSSPQTLKSNFRNLHLIYNQKIEFIKVDQTIACPWQDQVLDALRKGK